MLKYRVKNPNVMARVAVSGVFVDVPEGCTIETAMRDAGHIPDAFIYLIGGRPVPMDTEPPAESEVKALRVASGG